MEPQLFGIEHILYIIITSVLGAAVLLSGKRFAKTEKTRVIILKVLAALLLVAIITNRLSQVFRYESVEWHLIIPDSICGMTSLVLSVAVLFGKKDTTALHAVWLVGIFGGISTVIYATFLGQGPTIFYLPTISGLVHHSLSAMLVVGILMYGYLKITYKKWYSAFFGLTFYISVGAFLMNVFGMRDAFHLAEPLLEGTPLTIWVMAPIYAVCYAVILAVTETVRKYKTKKGENNEI